MISEEELNKFLSTPLFLATCQKRKAEQDYPKISILIPSYNQGRFLERTILSVLNQQYPNCELIVIDGGSQDCSIEILRKYNNYITYWVSEKDEGQADAINKGIRVASGDFFGWQNSDDIYLPGTFRDFAQVQNRMPGYEIYFGNRYTIDENDHILAARYLSKPSVYRCRYGIVGIPNQTAFFSRSVIKKYGEFDSSLHFALDSEFFMRAVLQRDRVEHISQFWGAFRYHGASKTGTGNQAAWKAERLYVRRKHHLPTGVKYVLHNKIARVIQRLHYSAEAVIFYLKFKSYHA
jgi:glycosyltransferase involved in cell wall biosynthesis